MRKPLCKLVPAIAAACLLTAGPAHAQFQDRAIRATLSAQKDHPLGVALTKVQQCVAQKSGGKMKIQTFFDGSLDSDVPTIQQLRSGTLDMVVTAESALIVVAAAALLSTALGYPLASCAFAATAALYLAWQGWLLMRHVAGDLWQAAQQ